MHALRERRQPGRGAHLRARRAAIGEAAGEVIGVVVQGRQGFLEYRQQRARP